MACGACQAKAARLKARAQANQQKADSPPQALMRCPGCNALHTEEEYQKCPFRIQHDKQSAREARIKTLQPQVVEVKQQFAPDRRGVGPSRPANSDKTDVKNPNQKKW